MKKSSLYPLMGFLPLVIGFFYIRTAAFPLLGPLFFTALPWVMVFLWVRAGWRCGIDGRGWLRSAAVAHWAVLLVSVCAVCSSPSSPMSAAVWPCPSLPSISSGWSPGSSGWSCHWWSETTPSPPALSSPWARL